PACREPAGSGRVSDREAEPADRADELRSALAAGAARAAADGAELLPDGRTDQPRRHFRPGGAGGGNPAPRGDDDPRLARSALHQKCRHTVSRGRERAPSRSGRARGILREDGGRLSAFGRQILQVRVQTSPPASKSNSAPPSSPLNRRLTSWEPNPLRCGGSTLGPPDSFHWKVMSPSPDCQ